MNIDIDTRSTATTLTKLNKTTTLNTLNSKYYSRELNKQLSLNASTGYLLTTHQTHRRTHVTASPVVVRREKIGPGP